MLSPDNSYYIEFIKNIENKLKPTNNDVHHFVSHDYVRQVYATFQNDHHDSVIKLVNDSVIYIYDLRSLTEAEQQSFIEYCNKMYSIHCEYHKNVKRLNINWPLILNTTPMLPEGFMMRTYNFQIFDTNGQAAGILLLGEKRNAKKTFTLGLFVNENSQGKGEGSRAMQTLSHFVDDERLGCESVHLELGSNNPKAALVYARSGYKPTDDFLNEMIAELNCTREEAHAKILFDSSVDSLPPNTYGEMVRKRGSKNQQIASALSEQELLTYVRSLNSSSVTKPEFHTVKTMFNQNAPTVENRRNRLPNGKDDMNGVLRESIQRENNCIDQDNLGRVSVS